MLNDRKERFTLNETFIHKKVLKRYHNTDYYNIFLFNSIFLISNLFKTSYRYTIKNFAFRNNQINF
jgi:hypothetical protein